MYISDCDNPVGNRKTRTSIINKYLTKALLNKLEDSDYDPIIQAQDCDKEMIKTLEIKLETGQKNVYSVCYTWANDNQRACIKLLLTEENESYLIDDILSDANIHGNQ
jgi:hypothetical protein